MPVFALPIQGQGRAMLIVVSLFFALTFISYLLESDDEYYADSPSSSSPNSLQRSPPLNLPISSLIEVNERIHFKSLNDDAFVSANLQRTNDFNKRLVYMQSTTVNGETEAFVTILYPYVASVNVQQYMLVKGNHSTAWLMIHDESINGQLHFAQESADSKCIYVSYEQSQNDGLDVSVHVKAICVNQERFVWDLQGSSQISSLSESSDRRCIYVSREKDHHAFRLVCASMDAESSLGPMATGMSIVNNMISLHAVQDNILVGWHLAAGIDSIRNGDKDQDDGMELFLEIFYKDQIWTSSYYAKLKHTIHRAVRRGSHSLNKIYFNGRRPTYQSADRRTIALCANGGEMVVVQLKQNTTTADSIKNAIVLDTVDITKYFRKPDKTDYSYGYSSGSYKVGRGNLYYGNNRADEFESTVSYLLRKQKESLMQQEIYSVPSKIVISPNGTMIGVLTLDQSKLLLLTPVQSKRGATWTITNFIHRTTLDQPQSSSSSDETWLSKLFQSTDDKSQVRNTKPVKKTLKILDVKFIDEGRTIMVLFDDTSIGLYSVTIKPASDSSQSARTESQEEDMELDTVDSVLLFVIENGKMIVLLSGVIIWFIINEIRLRRNIQRRREEITQQRQRERDRLQQTADNNNNNSNNTNNTSDQNSSSDEQQQQQPITPTPPTTTDPQQQQQ